MATRGRGPGLLGDWSRWTPPQAAASPRGRSARPGLASPDQRGSAARRAALAPTTLPALFRQGPRSSDPTVSATRASRPAPPGPTSRARLPRPDAPGRYAATVPARLLRTVLHLLRHRAIRVAVAVMLMIVLIVLVTAGAAAQRLYTFGQAISSQAPLSTGNFYMLGAGRVNLLVLGYGGPGHGGAYLTDSLMVISLIPSSGATTLISVPRDLWVQIPPGSGKYGKINAAYEYGLRNGYAGLPRGQPAAAALAARKVSDVIGVPVTNWLAIDFQGFRKLVDALGGVDVNVPTAFTARYPRADDESLDPGTKIIQFASGTQHMNGERAIEYARARYVLTPASEGSDFARSLRQQILVRAILARAKQMNAWPRLSDASKALEGTVKTNLSLADLGLFAEKMNFKNARHVGLSTANVLTSSTSADGQYILLPTNGDWTAVRRYVNAHLGQ